LNALTLKLKDVLSSVFPIIIIVLILNFTLTPLGATLLIRFLVGAAIIVLGLTFFLVGVDIGITPIGEVMGSTISKSKRFWIIAIAGLALGFFITIAEPALHVLAGQIQSVTSGMISKNVIVITVSLGVALLLTVGLLRIVYDFSIRTLFLIFYSIIFLLGLFTSREFLAVSFDAAGAATGALTIPFILALAVGASKIKKDSRTSERDSFGLAACVYVGPILSVMSLSILSRAEKITGSLAIDETFSTSAMAPFIEQLLPTMLEVTIALLPIIIVFLIFQKTVFKLPKHALRKILFGLLFTFIGFLMFLLGVNASFIQVGSVIGYKLASKDNKIYVIVVGFLFGLVTVLAEPSVQVLTYQIEEITSGYVKRFAVLFTLALGASLAIGLSVIRILVPQIQLWHYLLPGYIISIVTMYFVPDLFVGMAFDSGAVASGPMIATFIMAFTNGIGEAVEHASVVIDGFGMVATAAMTPVVGIQILGLIFKMKSRKGGIKDIKKD